MEYALTFCVWGGGEKMHIYVVIVEASSAKISKTLLIALAFGSGSEQKNRMRGRFLCPCVYLTFSSI